MLTRPSHILLSLVLLAACTDGAEPEVRLGAGGKADGPTGLILDQTGSVKFFSSDSFGPYDVSGATVVINMEATDDNPDLYVGCGGSPGSSNYGCAPKKSKERDEVCRIRIPKNNTQRMYIVIRSADFHKNILCYNWSAARIARRIERD